MNTQIKQMLIDAADMYENESFWDTCNDPVWFPQQFQVKKDIEISAFISSWLAYGKIESFTEKIFLLHEEMQWDPYEYIMSKEWMRYAGDSTTLYRFCKWHDFYIICVLLEFMYSYNKSFEQFLFRHNHSNVDVLKVYFGEIVQIPFVDSNSACKKLNMFLRWMIRKNSPVDLGIWTSFDQSELLVPIDTHVLKTAQKLGITNRKQADMKTCIEITNFGKEIFPGDPARLDFALYSIGLNNK